MNLRIKAVGMGLVLWLLVVGSATAAPALELSVRGEARLAVGVQKAGTTVEIRGRLYDDLGEPVPQQTVNVEVQTEAETVVKESVTTDFFGFFSVVAEVPAGTQKLEVSYEGASHLEGVEQSREIEVESAPVQLELEAPRWVHGEATSAPVQIEASVDGVGLPGYATVEVGQTPVASADLDAEGRATVDIGPRLQPGDNEVVVRIEETDWRDEELAALAVRRVDQLEVDGQLERVFERRQRGQEVKLNVSDGDEPLADVDGLVRLVRQQEDEDDEELVEQVQTDDEGRAAVLFADEKLGDDPWEVFAKVEPPRGDPVVWEGGRISREPSIWLRVGQLVALLVLVAGVGWFGRRPLVQLVERAASRFAAAPPEQAGAEEGRSGLERVEQVQLQVRQHTEDGESMPSQRMRLQLWDRWRDVPVRAATVRRIDEGEAEQDDLVSDATGMVDVPLQDLKRKCRVEARAQGYVPATAKLVPQGGGQVMRLEMTPVPLKIREAFRTFARRLQGEDVWGRMTPRQIADAIAQEGPVRRGATAVEWRTLFERYDGVDDAEQRVELLVRALTEAVEETNFSGRDYDVEVWEQVREVMKQLLERLDVAAGEKR